MAASLDSEDFGSLLKSSKKIDRERGAELLAKLYADADENASRDIEEFILDTLASSSQKPWEMRQGALMAAKVALMAPHHGNSEFSSHIQVHALELLDDVEYAVRITAGEVVGTLCMRDCRAVYPGIQSTILNGITSNLETADQLPANSATPRAVSHPIEHLTGEELFDPARWKHLETWIKCLQSVVESSSTQFNTFIDNNLLDVIAATLKSSNRFVRESACNLLSAIIGANCNADGKLVLDAAECAVCRYCDIIARLLADGLADIWSQVRMAACIAARRFLTCLPGGANNHPCFPTLLPALCLNRYYTEAEGVRLYSQETWKLVTEGKGKELVETHIDSVVEFYMKQLQMSNPEVKNAACACINELCLKMDRTALCPYVSRLIAALQPLFNDFIFSTRDASCMACGKLIAAFPEESKPFMDSIYPCLFELLQDNTPPVREAAAIAISSCVSAYGPESLKLVLVKVKEGLDAVGKTVASDETTGKIPASGVQTRIPFVHITAHTVSQATAAAASSQPGPSESPTQHNITLTGSTTHKYQRDPEPWELADGCVCLMCELSRLPFAVNEVAKLLPCLASAATHRHYTHYVFFLQSVCKQLPALFQLLGKRILKMYLDVFFDVIFVAASSDVVPVAEAGRQCIEQLSNDLGHNIFRARVQNYNPQFLQYLPGPKENALH